MSEKIVKVSLYGKCRVTLDRVMMVTPEDAEELRLLSQEGNDEEISSWFDWHRDICDPEPDEIEVRINGELVPHA